MDRPSNFGTMLERAGVQKTRLSRRRRPGHFRAACSVADADPAPHAASIAIDNRPSCFGTAVCRPNDSGAAGDMQTAPSCGIVGGPAAGVMANFHLSAVWPTAVCNVTRFTRLPRARVVISSETWRTECHRQISVGEACLAQIRIQS